MSSPCMWRAKWWTVHHLVRYAHNLAPLLLGNAGKDLVHPDSSFSSWHLKSWTKWDTQREHVPAGFPALVSHYNLISGQKLWDPWSTWKTFMKYRGKQVFILLCSPSDFTLMSTGDRQYKTIHRHELWQTGDSLEVGKAKQISSAADESSLMCMVLKRVFTNSKWSLRLPSWVPDMMKWFCMSGWV